MDAVGNTVRIAAGAATLDDVAYNSGPLKSSNQGGDDEPHPTVLRFARAGTVTRTWSYTSWLIRKGEHYAGQSSEVHEGYFARSGGIHSGPCRNGVRRKLHDHGERRPSHELALRVAELAHDER